MTIAARNAQRICFAPCANAAGMNSEPPNLSQRDRDRLGELTKSLACAWEEARQIGSTVVLAEYFPALDDSLRGPGLPALVAVDLRHRWKRGESIYIEDYLKKFPELGSIDTIPAQLIADEYRVRHQYGDQPPLAQFSKRFPRQYADVVKLLPEVAAAKPAYGTLVARKQSEEAGGSQLTSSGGSPHPNPDPFGVPARGEGTRGEATNQSLKPPAPIATAITLPAPPDSLGDTPPLLTPRMPAANTGPDVVLPFGGGYKLIRRIDVGKEGQFGDVWLAEAPGGIEVAIKIIRFPIGHQMSQIELRALELMKRIKHTFLLQIQAYWATEGQLVIVMELADGNLNDRAAECRKKFGGGIPVDELLGYFRETSEALDYLHSKDILHRDIKPANILLVEGHAKVGDFGLARVLRREDLSVTATSMGTPLYMPPEVWGGKASPHSDQYSLALAYVELRLGRPTYNSASFAEVMRDHLERSPDLGEIPAAEQQVILKALAKDYRERYPSCQDFARALAEAVRQEREPKQRARASLWNRRTMAVAMLAACAAAVAAFVWLPRIQFGPGEAAINLPKVVSVTAADSTSFVVSMHGPPSMNLADLKFVDLPIGVTMAPRRLDDNFEVAVAASLDAPAGTHPMKLVAELGDESWEQAFELRIVAPEVVVPRDFQGIGEPLEGGGAAPPKLVESDGKIYYQQIERVTPRGQHVAMVLVPRNAQRRDDPATYYIMVDKVWNELFAEFAAARPADLREKSEWTLGGEGSAGDVRAADHPKLPVMRVAFQEAENFAAWLGGKLPSAQQWDKAAGRFDQSASQPGPYRGVWNAKQPRGIAVARDDGPMPVGTAPLDVSTFGCRDMAGNGREWTRTIKATFDDASGEAPLRGIELRGRAYNAPAPLVFKDLEESEDQGIETEVDNRVDPTIGFRVVVEP